MVHKAGMAALIGKPNVGKSTILNALVGQKVSIVSDKPQTTRRRVLGIVTGEGFQVGFLDTPGFHEPHTRLGRAMVEQAKSALADVDAIVAVVDVSKAPDRLDHHLAGLVIAATEGSPEKRVVCLNKMDLLPPEFVTERVGEYQRLFRSEASMFTSATKRHNLDKLLDLIVERLPESPALFPEDEFTDQPARFLVAELIRERVLVSTRQEVPYAAAVRIDDWAEDEKALLRISASILVERPGQKAIVIGKGGAQIKKIGTEARKEIEALLGRHVFLELHVAVRVDWRMNMGHLRELEYAE